MSEASSSARRRVAVVVFNLGGPDRLQAVRPFLFNLFKDPAIIGLPAPFRQMVAALIAWTRGRMAKGNYAAIGGATPLLRETEAQAGALELELARTHPELETKVFVGMRYWKPTVPQAVQAVGAFGPDEIVLLPLYPQFSTTTTASSLKAWETAYRGRARVRAVCCYPDEAGLIEAHVHKIQAVLARAGRLQPVRILFSAHGLPETAIAGGDPYQWQIERTCAAVIERLGGAWAHDLDWKICYQSRVGPMKWLGPYTPAAIEEAAHEGLGVVVVPIAFVSEHVETLIELDRDYALLAEQVGCPLFLRVPTLGIEAAFVQGLKDLVIRALGQADPVDSGCGGRICPKQFRRCPVSGAVEAGA